MTEPLPAQPLRTRQSVMLLQTPRFKKGVDAALSCIKTHYATLKQLYVHLMCGFSWGAQPKTRMSRGLKTASAARTHTHSAWFNMASVQLCGWTRLTFFLALTHIYTPWSSRSHLPPITAIFFLSHSLHLLFIFSSLPLLKRSGVVSSKWATCSYVKHQ